MKVQNKTESTKLSTEKIEQLENPIISQKSNSKDDEKILGYIKGRKNAMIAKRGNIEKNWVLYIKQYEALFTPYRDGRSSSNVPLERAIIELFIAEAVKRPTRFNFNKCIGYESQAMIFEKVWKKDWSVNNRNSTILDNEYMTAIF
jgi:hypothetical protein